MSAGRGRGRGRGGRGGRGRGEGGRGGRGRGSRGTGRDDRGGAERDGRGGRGDGTFDRRHREAGRGNDRSEPSRRRGDDSQRRRFDAIMKGDEPFRNPVEDSRFILEQSIGTDDDDDLLSRLNFHLDKVTKALVNVNDFDLLVAFVQRLQKPMMSVGLRKRRTEDLLAACVQNAMLINDLISDKVESSSLPEASLKSLVLLVGTLATSEQHGDKARDDLQGLAETLIRAHAPGANDLQIVFKLDGRLLRALPANLEPFDRHDNDHEDWRKIKVVPTAGEVQTNRLPYIPEALNDEIQDDGVIPEATRMHLEHHFRLAREDYIGPLRQAAKDGTGRKYRKVEIESFDCEARRDEQGDKKHRSRGLAMITFEFGKLPRGLADAARDRKKGLAKQYWESSAARRILPENALVAFLDEKRDEKIIGFAIVIQRDTKDLLNTASRGGKEDMLPRPRIGIDISSFGAKNAEALLEYMGRGELQTLELIQTDTSLFAYRPFLTALKQMSSLPFAEELLMGSETRRPEYFDRNDDFFIENCIRELEEGDGFDYDDSQKGAIRRALTSRVSLTQGPPGTGKTHLGARLAKIIVDYTDVTILCVTVTNHACDDFLYEVAKAGVRREQIIRIGKEPKTDDDDKKWLKNRNLYTLSAKNKHRGGSDAAKCYVELENLTEELRGLQYRLMEVKEKIRVPRMKLFKDFFEDSARDETSERLQWSKKAFELPHGFTVIDNGNKVRGPDEYEYNDIRRWTLWDDWTKGKKLKDVFKDYLEDTHLWQISPQDRKKALNAWKEELRSHMRADAEKCLRKLQRTQELLREVHDANLPDILKGCRVIGCTTNAAAKHRELLAAANAKVLIVEEAGEVLENHVLASLPSAAEHLIMIGDHMQLRPKIENNDLSCENRGAKHHLNISLFERLIKRGLPHGLLLTQHRMHPEIARLVHGMYPDLMDGPRAAERKPVRGLHRRLQFINHDKPEDTAGTDVSSKSKSNSGEVPLVVNAVKYLCENGYGEADMVVLTSYVAQLVKITDALREAKLGADIGERDRDQLDDDALDAIEIAGGARHQNKRIRVAVVDNFQGEEADIVIVSLVRSNGSNGDADIGFLKNENRVNVLLSRARRGMIVIGNKTTFESKRANVWSELFPKFGPIRACLDGQCQTHGSRFDVNITDPAFDPYITGCGAPCGKVFDACKHPCTQSCHSGVCAPCQTEVRGMCPEGVHQLSKTCSKEFPKCREEVIIRCPADRHDLVRECSKQRQQCSQCQSEKAIADARERARAKALKEKEAEIRELHEECLKKAEEIARIEGGAELEEERAVAERRLDELRRDRDAADERLKQRTEEMNREIQEREVDAAAKQEEKRREAEDVLTKRMQEMRINLTRIANDGAHSEAQVEDARRQLHQINERFGKEDCIICLDELPQTDLFKCDGGHGLCGDCFESHVRTSCDTNDDTLFKRFAQDGCKVLCTNRDTCKCEFPPDVLARDRINHEHFMKAMLEHQAIVVRKEEEIRFEAELKRRENESMLDKSVREIEETILTLKCPRCKWAFADYDGCSALYCRNPDCRAGFCAFCQADCGADAHAHVATCPEILAGNLQVVGGFFAGGWEEHMVVIRKRRVEEYLGKPGVVEQRAAVLDKLKVQLDHLEIKIE